MKRMYVLERWDEFARTFPKDIDANKKQWLRAAFYTGALGMLDVLENLFVAGEGEPTEADIETLVSIQQELTGYFEDLIKKAGVKNGR